MALGSRRQGGHGATMPFLAVIVHDPDISLAEAVASPATSMVSPSFAELLAHMPNLRWIHSLSARRGWIRLPRAKGTRCTLTNGRGIYAPAMAEYAVAGMVMLARGMPRYLENQRGTSGGRRSWRQVPSSTETGCRSGLRRGRALYRGICRWMGMEVWASRRSAGLRSASPSIASSLPTRSTTCSTARPSLSSARR